MLTYAIMLAFGIVAAAIFLCAFRLFEGPSILDRVVALDTMYINSIALLILGGIWWNLDLYFEAALLIAMMGFVSTVGMAKFLLRGNIIE
ncbi:K+/H+ antiporter subunit F [Lujinxingia litoralis]|uniref:K+/H+ antiporter subunit F n=1 Tax=Lujinxingia litoralis TaxID=2211119 RepID=A0A328C4X1_9DELT|nr:K+/H+ antiporter subunit F [Lujinxingia litoralis]